jgi:NADPH-ferrihemoprotein reductase
MCLFWSNFDFCTLVLPVSPMLVSNGSRPFNAQNPYLATVLVNRELYTDGERSCRHIELDISSAAVRYALAVSGPLTPSYAAGDHVAVYASNNEQLVQRLAKRLGLDLDAVFSLVAVDGELALLSCS